MLDKLKGKSLEIYGDADSGKTKFSLSLIDEDDLVLFIDVDRKIYDIKNNKENIFLYHCNSIEEIYDFLQDTISYLDVVIIDSLPSLKNENYDIESKNIDSEFYNIIKKIISLCKSNNCTILIINQIRYIYEETTFAYKHLFKYYNLRIKIDNNKPIITYNNLNKKLDLYNFF